MENIIVNRMLKIYLYKLKKKGILIRLGDLQKKEDFIRQDLEI